MGILDRLAGRQLPTVTVTKAHDRAAGTLLLDVREPVEWATGHAPGAVHLPMAQVTAARLPEAKRYYVICRSGNRSAQVARSLTHAGVDASNVAGGMIAWERAGLPITTG